ncbi:MAG: TonB-system energizer ExbB [Elusimicrobia bacterium RIFOXYB2_FULL_49_7]|nr:MAG: TonB-system energizer ExbB [Elusimicrobia bacterium RIFOXYB2_FULL_49_7]
MEWIKVSVDWGVIGLLLALSIISFGIGLERWLFYRHIIVTDFQDKRKLEITLTAKLHLLATIGSNAPYIGLLGTVLGIMLTFHTIGQQGYMETAKIMTSLALALKATAMGILVAIPSVALYNTLLRRVKVLLTEWDIAHG